MANITSSKSALLPKAILNNWILAAVICVLAGAAAGLWVKKIKFVELQASLEQKASNLLLLTNSYFDTYSEVARMHSDLPPPAVFRAHAQYRFNQNY